MTNDLHQNISGLFPQLPARDFRQAPALVLAYVGDTVYDLYVRTLLVHKSDAAAHGLHVQSAGLVCANAQAQAYRRIEHMLSPEEEGVYRRGRNAHMGSIPKNASIMDYRIASGLEALLGYLYLTGQDQRLQELMYAALKDAFYACPTSF